MRIFKAFGGTLHRMCIFFQHTTWAIWLQHSLNRGSMYLEAHAFMQLPWTKHHPGETDASTKQAGIVSRRISTPRPEKNVSLSPGRTSIPSLL